MRPSKPFKVLIVKTSALGDIVQSFNVLDYLHGCFPGIQIDWVVERSLASLVAAHPLISRTIPLDLKGLKKSPRAWLKIFSELKAMRSERYDAIFDLQGNCKSGIITSFTRGAIKVGFGWHSVRERPNMLATNRRFDVPREMNIRLQYVHLIQRYFEDSNPPIVQGVRFKIEESEQEKLRSILARPELAKPMRIMVCPGSKWINKQLPLETLVQVLQKIQSKLNASFLLMWGAEQEKLFCEEIAAQLPNSSLVIEKLLIPTWQNLMNETQLVIAVDSSALHLCGTTRTPSFSLFGPTSPHIFKPIGVHHFAMQGPCPYGRTFLKACPIMRTCPTGACLRALSADAIFASFDRWWQTE